MMRSCVRVRPIPNNGADPELADTRSNFQVGVTFPLDTMTNFISIEMVSGVVAPPPPAPPCCLEAGALSFDMIAAISVGS